MAIFLASRCRPLPLVLSLLGLASVCAPGHAATVAFGNTVEESEGGVCVNSGVCQVTFDLLDKDLVITNLSCHISYTYNGNFPDLFVLSENPVKTVSYFEAPNYQTGPNNSVSILLNGQTQHLVTKGSKPIFKVSFTPSAPKSPSLACTIAGTYKP